MLDKAKKAMISKMSTIFTNFSIRFIDDSVDEKDRNVCVLLVDILDIFTNDVNEKFNYKIRGNLILPLDTPCSFNIGKMTDDVNKARVKNMLTNINFSHTETKVSSQAIIEFTYHSDEYEICSNGKIIDNIADIFVSEISTPKGDIIFDGGDEKNS